jgi:hypothetical protein
METIFGPPPILPGEDGSAYEALVRQVIADVKPADIIEKIWVRDIVDLTWEILRWRRIKKTLVSLHMVMKHEECFEVPASPEGTAQSENYKREASQQTAILWFKEDPKFLAVFKKLEKHKVIFPMTTSIDAAFVAELDRIERIDRLIAGVESRRNRVFCEIDRRRAFARSLRDAIQKAEDADFEVIEPKSNARTARANGKAA